MSRQSFLRWLRRVALEDAGYALAFPALVLGETVLSQVIIHKISFTEIDFQTYLGQSALFLAGERDYSRLEPEGGSGPCVYPAGHVYLYAFLHRLTRGGADILPAQYVFQGLLTVSTLLVAALYRQAGIPPIMTVPLVLSKRIHSIFLLRMFNDPVALVFVYASLYLAVKGRWIVSGIALSLGLGIKMNVLLFLPGLVVAAFIQTGLLGTLVYLSGIALVQALLSLPFTLHNPQAYMVNSFDFSRVFLYKWTVNWRFVSEETFSSKPFADALLLLHLSLLVLFGLFKWTSLGTIGPRWFIQNKQTGSPHVGRAATVGLLSTVFTCNAIGILCSRSLHYQFYSWYFHQVPFLLWFSKLPILFKLAIPLCLEWGWNVFPSSPESSLTLLLCHVVLVAGCCTLPTLTPSGEEQLMTVEDEVEVEMLLLDGQTAATSTDGAAAHADQLAAKYNDAIAKERLQEQKQLASFQRRMAVRRKLLSIAGRGVLLLRTLLVVGALALLCVLVHPNSPVAKGTYVDENALQPGQSRVYWDYFDVTHADMLSEKVEHLGRIGTSEQRAEFVRAELASYGLDAHKQKYRYERGETIGMGNEAQLEGVNAYARSATPRIDGREAVILTASWKSQERGGSRNSTLTADRSTNVRGVASLLALARYLSTQAHLSKDLIFVVSDEYLEGINVWSGTYFGSRASNIDADPIEMGGSHVWNAISLDYPADSFSSLVVQYEGMDGQLPNMDVVNTLVRVAERVANGVPTFLASRSSSGNEHSFLLDTARRISTYLQVPLRQDVEYELQRYEQGARSAARQFGFGVTGNPSGPHGLFQRFHVDAITIYAVPASGPYGFYHMGRVVESFVRSMSNLLERLHHSQFLYLLITTHRFVPIGIVILVPLFLSISMTISGLQIWFQEEERSRDLRASLFATAALAQAETQDAEPEFPTLQWYLDQLEQRWMGKFDDDCIFEPGLIQLRHALTRCSRPYQNAFVSVGASLSVGVLTLVALSSLSHYELARLLDSFPAWSPPAMCMQFSAIVANALARQMTGLGSAHRLARLVHSFAYIQAGMALAVLSVLNFALATVLALALLLALTLTYTAPKSHWTNSIVRFAILTSLNPLSWPVLSTVPLIPSALQQAVNAHIRHWLVQWSLIPSHTLPILCLVYIPLILQLQISLLLHF